MRRLYVEDLLALNFLINTFLLYLASRITGKPVESARRLTSGGILAALYSLVIFLPWSKAAYGWAGKLLASLLIVAFTFRPRRVVELLRLSGAFFLASFSLAGAVFALHFFGGMPAAAGSGIFYITPPHPGVLFWGVLVISLLLAGVWRYGERLRAKSGLHYRLVVSDKGREVVVPALLDTGNSLREPFSGRPLCIVTFAAIKQLLPPCLSASYETGADPVSALGALEDFAAGRFGVAPFRSVENSGMLVTFRPEALFLEDGMKRREIKGIVLAITGKPLTVDTEVGALLHPEVVKW